MSAIRNYIERRLARDAEFRKSLLDGLLRENAGLMGLLLNIRKWAAEKHPQTPDHEIAHALMVELPDWIDRALGEILLGTPESEEKG